MWALQWYKEFSWQLLFPTPLAIPIIVWPWRVSTMRRIEVVANELLFFPQWAIMAEATFTPRPDGIFFGRTSHPESIQMVGSCS